MSFDKTIEEYEKERNAAYITNFERRYMQRGKLQGRRDAIIDFLIARFGELSPELTSRINSLDDVGALQALLKRAATVSTPQEVLKS